MTHRFAPLALILFLLAGCVLPPPKPLQMNDADRAAVAQVQDYLNQVQTLQTRFLQTSANGATTQGTAWLDRPGRLRLQYDPPDQTLVIAAAGDVTLLNGATGSTTSMPADRTPLGILLDPRIDLAGNAEVTAVHEAPGSIEIGLIRTGHYSDGTLTLLFTTNPLALRRLRLLDAHADEIRMNLVDTRLNDPVDPKLFVVPGG